jgi:cytochrome c-type biogenesis protein CcmH/NrfF
VPVATPRWRSSDLSRSSLPPESDYLSVLLWMIPVLVPIVAVFAWKLARPR